MIGRDLVIANYKRQREFIEQQLRTRMTARKTVIRPIDTLGMYYLKLLSISKTTVWL